jgi:predicted anti-sigma-YlaC factor YlaD
MLVELTPPLSTRIPMKWLRWLLRAVTVIYGLACVVSLMIMAVHTQGWFGVAPEGLAAVYALVLAMPWTLLLSILGPGNMLYAVLLTLAGMGINIAFLLWLQRRLR